MGRLHLPLIGLIMCVLFPAYDCARKCRSDESGWCNNLDLSHQPQPQPPMPGLQTDCEDKYPSGCSYLLRLAQTQTTYHKSRFCHQTTICKKTCGKCSAMADNTDDESICNLPMDVGPCRAKYPSYYYNPREGACVRFGFGGCRGNKNNFGTFQECQKKCGGPSPPSTAPPPGCTDRDGVHHNVGSVFKLWVPFGPAHKCTCFLVDGEPSMNCHGPKSWTESPDTTAGCPKSWPNLIGVPFQQAKATIMHDCPKLYVQKYHDYQGQTLEKASHRVRVIVNGDDTLVMEPRCCS